MDLRARQLRERDPAAVVIGGSAGSLEALQQIIPALPPRLPIPVVVVVHVPSDRPSALVEVLADRSALPVQEAADKAPMEPGKVYVAPPGYHLQLEPGAVFSLSVDPPVHFSRPSIDVLFSSAAWVYGGRLLAILLSGANADGAEGLAEIGAAGGVTWVQDPETASALAMPQAGIDARPPTQVLSPEQMAEVLRAWSGGPHAGGA